MWLTYWEANPTGQNTKVLRSRWSRTVKHKMRNSAGAYPLQKYIKKIYVITPGKPPITSSSWSASPYEWGHPGLKTLPSLENICQCTQTPLQNNYERDWCILRHMSGPDFLFKLIIYYVQFMTVLNNVQLQLHSLSSKPQINLQHRYKMLKRIVSMILQESHKRNIKIYFSVMKMGATYAQLKKQLSKIKS